MTPAYRTAYVYVRNIFAGILSETDKGYIILYQIFLNNSCFFTNNIVLLMYVN